MHDAFAGEQKRAAMREAMAAILARYPQIDDAETDRLVLYLRKEASALDTALLSASDETRRTYRQFRGDHAVRFRATRRDRIVGLAAFALLMLTVALLWDVGR